jgi:hypothetical protein
MNFYQAPIARIVSIADKDEQETVSPIVPICGIFSPGGLPFGHGKNVTVFFETPGWPTASSKINVRGHVIGTPTEIMSGCAGTTCVVAPNICLSDADSYLFLRGNNVYGNNQEDSTLGSHVMYSAQIDVSFVNPDRASAENGYWVRPGDTIIFTNPFIGQAGSNLGIATTGDGTISNATITSVRHKAGSKSFLVEFTVPISLSDIQDYAGGAALSTWGGRDLVFYQGGAPQNATQSKGLSYNKLTLEVEGPADAKGHSIWRGTIHNAINLTYTSANRPGLIPSISGGSAELVDPSKLLICNSHALRANGRLQMGLTGVAAYHSDYQFEYVSDFNQGSVPYRCVSISAPASSLRWVLEIVVHPLH